MRIHRGQPARILAGGCCQRAARKIAPESSDHEAIRKAVRNRRFSVKWGDITFIRRCPRGSFRDCDSTSRKGEAAFDKVPGPSRSRVHPKKWALQNGILTNSSRGCRIE